LRAAKRHREELQTDARRGQIAGPSERFDRYARAWVDSYAGRTSRGLREATRADYREQLERYAIPHFGKQRLDEITPTDVRDFIRVLAKRKSDKTKMPLARNTIRLALSPVKALLATARDDGLIPTNPAAGVRLVVSDASEPRAKVGAWSPAELAGIVTKLPERWRLFACLLAETGLRIGEAVELRWVDLDLGARELRVERSYYRGHVNAPKSRYGRRRLRLSELLARELWALRKHTRDRDRDLVFRAEAGGRVSARVVAADVFRPAADAAGARWLGWHGFRHTCATALFREGANAKQVQVWLGHHSAAFTLATYVHLLPEDLPAPPSIGAAALAGMRHVCDTNATQSGRDVPKRASTEKLA
jgi:integrase